MADSEKRTSDQERKIQTLVDQALCEVQKHEGRSLRIKALERDRAESALFLEIFRCIEDLERDLEQADEEDRLRKMAKSERAKRLWALEKQVEKEIQAYETRGC